MRLQFHFDLPLLLRPARRELGGGLQHGLHAGRRECVEHRFHNGLLDRHATEDATELLADRLALCRYTVVIQIFYSSLSVFDASPFAMGQDFSSSWNPGATS